MTSRQDDIVRAAARCIARQGVRGLRVHDVAAEAGVSTSLLYYHFADRDGLLAATLAHVDALVPEPRTGTAADLTELLLGEITDDDAIRAGSVAWSELRASAAFEDAIREPLARRTAAWNDRIQAALETAGAPGDTAMLAIALTALVEGLTGRWISGELTTDEARGVLAGTVERLVPAGVAA
ncbi:TetR family transcriptional regulator [Aeromicrobium sp. NPDC092404]|uniref:TetR/AcrR family transcriptional regulator n=1 Tax=Aeromicrobium sp. NPDC092404 TaxID=3154976 RepID=UPI00342B9177